MAPPLYQLATNNKYILILKTFFYQELHCHHQLATNNKCCLTATILFLKNMFPQVDILEELYAKACAGARENHTFSSVQHRRFVGPKLEPSSIFATRFKEKETKKPLWTNHFNSTNQLRPRAITRRNDFIGAQSKHQPTAH